MHINYSPLVCTAACEDIWNRQWKWYGSQCSICQKSSGEDRRLASARIDGAEGVWGWSVVRGGFPLPSWLGSLGECREIPEFSRFSRGVVTCGLCRHLFFCFQSIVSVFTSHAKPQTLQIALYAYQLLTISVHSCMRRYLKWSSLSSSYYGVWPQGSYYREDAGRIVMGVTVCKWFDYDGWQWRRNVWEDTTMEIWKSGCFCSPS